MALEDVPRCQHVKVNGTQCGSPALRRRRHCYFHEKIRREQVKIAANFAVPYRFELPLLEDANSVQMALMKVMQLLGSRQMDHRTAGLMLYALQTASVNLRNTEFEVDEVTDVVIDRDDVHRTVINGQQWFESDFDRDEEESEEENDGETVNNGEDTVASVEANAESSAELATKKEVKPVSLEDARGQVRSIVLDWLAEKADRKPQ